MNVEETVARWQAEEDSVRARLALTAGYARPEQIDGLTGLQMLEALLADPDARRAAARTELAVPSGKEPAPGCCAD